jgi:hypothetical protein
MPASSAPRRSRHSRAALTGAVLLLAVALWASLVAPDAARTGEVRRGTDEPASLIVGPTRGPRAVSATAAGPSGAAHRAVLVAVTPSALTLPAALSFLLAATVWVAVGRPAARGHVALRAPPRLHAAV